MRLGIEILLSITEKLWNNRNENPVFFYASVGYGKSVAAPYLLELAKRIGVAESLIHVLPSRSLVLNLYLCKYLYPFATEQERCKLREICMDRTTHEELANVIRKVVRGREYVAYQAGTAIKIEVEPGKELQVVKSPLFEDVDIVVTTIDSLMYNAFKIPLTEVYKTKKHYAIPFSWIYTSLVCLDEIHASLERELFSSILVLLDIFSASKIPVVAFTATPVPGAIEAISRYTSGRVRPIVVEMYHRNEDKNGVYRFRDDDFEGEVLSVKWRTFSVSRCEVVEKVLEQVKSGYRVLIALDSITRAVALYEELRRRPALEDLVVLLHGKMTREHQRRVLERLSNSMVIVSTPVINAGVDISFDVAFLGTRDPITSIQFVGRVCRDNKCGEAEVYLIKEYTNSSLLAIVNSISERGKTLNWHLPYSLDSTVGYDKLLDLVNVPTLDRKNLRKLVRLRDLAFTALLTASEIQNLFYELEGEIARNVLTEIIVATKDEIESLLAHNDLDRAISRLEDMAITMSFSEALEYLKSSFSACVDKFIVITIDGSIKYLDVEQNGIRFENRTISKSYDYVSMLMRLKARFAGFILRQKAGCYDDERGLLCLLR